MDSTDIDGALGRKAEEVSAVLLCHHRSLLISALCSREGGISPLDDIGYSEMALQRPMTETLAMLHREAQHSASRSEDVKPCES